MGKTTNKQTIKELSAKQQSNAIAQKAQAEMKECQDKIGELLKEYDCRLEAQVTINSKGIRPDVIIQHNLLG